MAEPLTLQQIVARLGGEALGEPAAPLTGVGTLESASASQLAFLANPRYRAKLATTKAGAVILGPRDRDATAGPRIVADNPYAYYARVVALFHPAETVRPGIHPFAQVDGSANVDATATIEAFAVVGARCEIGPHARIGAHCSLGDHVHVGERTRLHPRVSIYSHCRIGARGIVHSGAVIGADGFGQAPEEGRWVKIPQVGGVRIGDDVEIGANTTIDRGALDDTVIEDGVKLDNLIQIAHNCVIGAHTVIAGCTGISGSTRVGRHCLIGGGVGIVGHVEICDGVTISGFSLVAKSILKPGTYTSGMPLMPHAQWLRNAAHLRRLDELARGRRADDIAGQRGKAGDDSE